MYAFCMYGVAVRFAASLRSEENEGNIADAIRRSGIPREDVFLITKIWFDDMGETLERKNVLDNHFGSDVMSTPD